MIARDVVKLLEARHSDDIFVEECKNGPTHTASHSRLDAWAMAKSWVRPAIFGYEVKVSRGDFLQDNKWPSYLPMCNHLFFVCPTGLIKPEELPAEVGLLWASKTGGKLYTKKKAPRREIPFPEDVVRYVLMSRVRVTREYVPITDKRQFWTDWMAEQQVDAAFGRGVSSAISRRIREEIEKVRAENEGLAAQNARYADIRKLLESLGIDPEARYRASTYEVERKLNEARKVLPPDLLRSIAALKGALERAEAELTKIETPDTEKSWRVA